MISSWDDLRYLEALDRLGSSSAAGRALNVAVSTVYRRIAALEQSVGFACLVRGKGLTAAGSELAALSRSIWILTHPEVRHDARVKAVMKALSTHLRGSTP